MKRFTLGLIIGLVTTAMASVGTGEIIKADLINKILDIKIPTGDNTYVAKINNQGDVSTVNISNWISKGSTSSGIHVLNFQGNLFSQAPICVCSVNNGGTGQGNDAFCNVGEASTSSVTINMENAASSKVNQKIYLNCTRAGLDYNQMKSIREIVQELGFVF